MATGKLVQGDGKASPLTEIGLYLHKVLASVDDMPACVRVNPKTLSEPPMCYVGVRIIHDKRVQPGCYFFCETMEP